MIYLKKDYVSKSGNFYGRGQYNSIEQLPKTIRTNPEYISGKEINNTLVLNSEDRKHIGPTKETQTIKPIVSKIVEEPKLNINSATIEEISALRGIGRATAKKIHELREESPFSSKEDLNNRVPLYGSRDWNEYSVLFES